MFRFFKRPKMQPWLVPLLQQCMTAVAAEHPGFVAQLTDGLVAGTFPGQSDMPGYTGLRFNPDVHDKYFEQQGPNFYFDGISVLDVLSGTRVPVRIYAVHGVLIGLQHPTVQKLEPDLNSVSTIAIRQVMVENDAVKHLKQLLSSAEFGLLNPADVYEVELDGALYFHALPLEDGDFMGYNATGQLVKATHDPFEIVLMPGSIADYL